MRKKVSFAVLLCVLLISGAFKQQGFSSIHEISLKPEHLYKEESSKLTPELEHIVARYDSLLTSEMINAGTVGAAAAVIHKGQIIFLKCFGVKKAGTDDPINKNTVFRLASVSKAVTGVLAGILANEQVIGLDDKVIDYLPSFSLNNPRYTESLTIRNLLSHTTGLVPHAYDDLVEHHMPLSTIIERFKMAGTVSVPGSTYGYQNVMFSLIDTIVNVKTSKNYGQLVTEKLFKPYGMRDASTDFETFKNNPNKAYPHTAISKNKFRSTRLNDRYYSTAPAAGINASISDMAHFLQALMKDQDYQLTQTVHQTVFEPQVVSPLSRGYFRYWNQNDINSKQYALGWRIVGYKGRQVAYHGGYVSGYKAEIALCKEDEVGIVFLTNSPNSAASKSVPEFLNLFFGYKDHQMILTDNENIKTEEEVKDLHL